MPDTKPIDPLTMQIVHRTLGAGFSTYMGNDIYYLIRVIYLLKANLGDNYLKKQWEESGYNWNKIMVQLEKLNKKAIEVKSFYDALEDKKFENKSKEVNIKKYYFATASKLPALIPEIYNFFIFIVKHSAIQRSSIPSDAWKIIEHRNLRNLDFTSKRPIQQQQNINSQTNFQS